MLYKKGVKLPINDDGEKIKLGFRSKESVAFASMEVITGLAGKATFE